MNINASAAFSLVAFITFNAFLTTCRSRDFADGPAYRNSSTVKDSTSEQTPDSAVLKDFQSRLDTTDMIVEDPAFPAKDEPPMDYTVAYANPPPGTFWENAGPEFYKDLAGAPLTKETFEALRRPSQKEKELSGSQVPLPKVMIAAALARLKTQFYLGKSTSDDKMILDRVRGTPFEKLWIQSPGDREGAVVSVAPNHWSDIVSHFYAATPVLTHACWSLASGRFAEAPSLASGGSAHRPPNTRRTGALHSVFRREPRRHCSGVRC